VSPPRLAAGNQVSPSSQAGKKMMHQDLWLLAPQPALAEKICQGLRQAMQCSEATPA
jgi:hypothetical protein